MNSTQLAHLAVDALLGYTAPTSQEVGIGVPESKAQQPRPAMDSGFSFSDTELRGGAASFMVGRVGHSQGCAGSLVRYANLHGLPPSIGVECGGIDTCHQGAIMADTAITTGASAHIVPTFTSTIGGVPALCCDARTLHAYLGTSYQFTDWFKQRCDKYGFEEGKDYAIASKISEAKTDGRGGHNRTDYHLSLNMAKELSMVENNDQGRAARRYFLDCERKALEAAGQVVPASHTDTITPSEQQNLQELVDAKCRGAADQGKARAEVWSRLHHKFRVAKYSQLPRTQLTEAQLYIMAMQLRGAEAEAPTQARERITARDLAAITRVVWFIAHGFRSESSWTQGVWFYLRKALNNPAPNPWYADQLPAMAHHLGHLMAETHAVRDFMAEVERQAVRRILRQGNTADLVVADMERLGHKRLTGQRAQLASLPSWLHSELTAITDRSQPGYDMHHGSREQPGYFASLQAAA